MKVFSTSWFEKIKRMDFLVVFCAVAMSTLSVVTLASASDTLGTRRVIVQSAASLLGIAFMVIIAMLDYDAILEKLTFPLVIASVLLLLLVFFVGEGDGNRNWIRIPGLPFDIQPAEFVKVVFIMTFARHLNLVKSRINHPRSVFFLLLHGGTIVGLVLLTGDLGSALVYLVIMAFMLFAAGLSVWYFVAALVAAAVAFPILFPHLSEYQQMRIMVGFRPELDPIKYGYQALLSKKAISFGGLWGNGFSGGEVYKTLPIAESDFIFSVLCEKFGFFGAFSYLALISTLVIRLLVLARGARKDYGAYMCVGVAAILIAQASENIGMCLAMLPVVGITLPFLSYGGSSMLSLYLALGLVQSISAHNKKYYFEREHA